MWCMAVIWDELDEKWIEKEKFQNSGITALCVYSVDWTLSRLIGQTGRQNRNPVHPVDITAMMSTEYTAHLEEPSQLFGSRSQWTQSTSRL
ncbi:hypothetical protein AAC387_Pa07g3125 [Persea americana]